MVGCKAQSFFPLPLLSLLAPAQEGGHDVTVSNSPAGLSLDSPSVSHLNLCYEACSYCKQTGIVSYFNIPLHRWLCTRQKQALRISSPCFSLVLVAIETQFSKELPAVSGCWALMPQSDEQPAGLTQLTPEPVWIWGWEEERGGEEEEIIPSFDSAVQQLQLRQFQTTGHQKSFPALNVQLGKQTERKGTSFHFTNSYQTPTSISWNLFPSQKTHLGNR